MFRKHFYLNLYVLAILRVLICKKNWKKSREIVRNFMLKHYMSHGFKTNLTKNGHKWYLETAKLSMKCYSLTNLFRHNSHIYSSCVIFSLIFFCLAGFVVNSVSPPLNFLTIGKFAEGARPSSTMEWNILWSITTPYFYAYNCVCLTYIFLSFDLTE